jgi:hypothetical protein
MLARDLSADTVALAHEDLIQLRVDLFPYEPNRQRAW